MSSKLLILLYIYDIYILYILYLLILFLLYIKSETMKGVDAMQEKIQKLLVASRGEEAKFIVRMLQAQR